MYIYKYIHMYTYIYIYIYRERERERHTYIILLIMIIRADVLALAWLSRPCACCFVTCTFFPFVEFAFSFDTFATGDIVTVSAVFPFRHFCRFGITLALLSGVHKGGFSKGGFSNNDYSHELLNPPLLNPPL